MYVYNEAVAKDICDDCFIKRRYAKYEFHTKNLQTSWIYIT